MFTQLYIHKYKCLKLLLLLCKFLKCRLRMNSGTCSYGIGNRILFMVKQFIQYEAVSLWWQQMM